MPGILYQRPPSGLLSEPEPQGLMGALYQNPLLARQVAAHRAANPRQDVTDLFGYGPNWTSYLQNMNRNLQAQLPQLGDSGQVMAEKGLGMLGNFGLAGVTKMPKWLSKEDMIKRGADGYLARAQEMEIPLSKISGREPVPAMEGGYVKGRKITQPIEVVYQPENDTYILYSGNHRVRQAEINGQDTIKAFVEVEK